MFGWFKKKVTSQRSLVAGIVALMDQRPREWEFSARGKQFPYAQTLAHTKTDLKFTLCYHNSHSPYPDKIQAQSSGQVAFRGQEKNVLLCAVERLRHSRFDAVASQFLKLETRIVCCACKDKIIGWGWVCKCQSVLDQTCYQNSNICPDCGGTLVDLTSRKNA